MRGSFIKLASIFIILLGLLIQTSPVMAENVNTTIYFTKGHGEPSIDKDFTKLKEFLIQNKFNIKSINLDTYKRIPSDLDVLIILSPKADLTIAEKNMIDRYVDKGGKIVLSFGIPESGKRLVNFESIMKRFNLSIGCDKVKENDVKRHIVQDNYTFIPEMPENEINKKQYSILITDARSVGISSFNKAALAVPLLMASEKATAESAIQSAEDKKGPLTLAAAAIINTPNYKSKMVLIGSSEFISDSAYSRIGPYDYIGRQYVVDLLKWISRNETARTVKLSVGFFHCLTIHSDGTLWAWGSNESGQLGDGTQTDRSRPVQVGKDKDWAEVSAGSNYSLAIKKDGTLWAWGTNNCGQLGDGTIKNKSRPIKVSSLKFSKVTAGCDYSLAICEDGTLWESGDINRDTLDTANMYKAKFRQVGMDTDWKCASISLGHALVLKNDGTIWGLGAGGNGQLGNGNSGNISKLIQVGTQDDWTGISAGWAFTIAQKKDGSLWRWGYNNSSYDLYEPTQIGNDSDWSGFSACMFTAAVKSDGTLWSWGYDAGNEGMLESSDMTNSTPVKVTEDVDWDSVGVGGSFAIALKRDGTLWSWGYSRRGQLGSGIRTVIDKPVRVGEADDWSQVSAGFCHTLALKRDGTLWAWGSNLFGESGQYTNFNVETPAQIGYDHDWHNVFSIAYTSFAIKKDGTLWAWGDNKYGQFGNGNKYNSTMPLMIGTDLDWKDVASAGNLMIGLKNNGTLWTWGKDPNPNAINGLESPIKGILVPEQIGTDTDWKKISDGFGQRKMTAMKNDGSIWVWHYAYPNKSADVFRKISGKKDWIDMEAGYSYNVMLKEDHSLWCDANDTDIYYGFDPVKVGQTGEWKSISTYGKHVLAIKTDNSLWAFGQNYHSEIGDETCLEREIPVRVGEDADWIQASAGEDYSVGIRGDGSLWSWGRNSQCQLGIGKTKYIAAPEEIMFKKYYE